MNVDEAIQRTLDQEDMALIVAHLLRTRRSVPPMVFEKPKKKRKKRGYYPTQYPDSDASVATNSPMPYGPYGL